MTAGVGLIGQINVFHSVGPDLSQVLVWNLRNCIGSFRRRSINTPKRQYLEAGNTFNNSK